MLGNYKIRVNNEAESKEAQELFFEMGYKFEFCADIQSCRQSEAFSFPYFVQATEFGQIIFAIGQLEKAKELTLPQLRDLVVLHRKDVKDATHTDGERKGFLSSDGVEYFWNAYDLEWFKAKQMTFAYEKFKPIQEQGLISGADALRALADGKEVQCTITGKNDWTKDIYSIQPYYFVGGGVGQFQFRIKPRTITLNVEIPAPFEPKDGEIFWFVSPYTYKGYDSKYFVDDCTGFLLNGVWRTEEEIKQVVAALRCATCKK